MSVYKTSLLCSLLGLVLLSSVAIALSLDSIPRRLHLPSHHGLKQEHQRKFEDSSDDEMQRIARNGMEAMRKPGLFTNAHTNHGSHWESTYSSRPHIFRDQVKRDTKKHSEKLDKDKANQELLDILKDDDADKKSVVKDNKMIQGKKKDKTSKRKRESTEQDQVLEEQKIEEPKDLTHENHEFQDWLRKEYYRNMAKSFATMRKKRDMWGPMDSAPLRESHKTNIFKPHHDLMEVEEVPENHVSNDDVSIEDVTDNLEAIKTALLVDVLKVYKQNGKHFMDDEKMRRRVANDINAAYDIETMRSALFRLGEILSNMDDENNEPAENEIFTKPDKRADQCPPLNVLTSDCVILGDIVPDDTLKDLLTHACNWHEVCYSCGETFGLSSDNCDMGFVEQSRTICKGDVPCETTANLLLLPLRQRRVFYKRSNPAVCLMDTCVEDFLTKA